MFCEPLHLSLKTDVQSSLFSNLYKNPEIFLFFYHVHLSNKYTEKYDVEICK